MEPLRLELSEEVSLELRNTPQFIKDEVENMHSVLIAQVRRFYRQKRDELEDYTRKLIRNSDTEVESSPTKDETERKLKSIVKRRPSRSDKRVSFSKSPPKVEHLKDYDEDDVDHEAEYLPSKWPPVKDIPSPYQHKATDNNEAPDNAKKPGFEVKVAKPLFNYKPAIPNSPKHKNNSEQTENKEADTTQEQLFDLEDVINNEPEPSYDSSPESSVADHHSQSRASIDDVQRLMKKEDEQKRAAGASQSEGQTDPALFDDSEVSPRDTFHVGSLPLDIKPNPNIVTPDGGPPEKTEELQRREELEDAALFSPMSSSFQDASSIDPSKMSFTQRIEWEKFRKINDGYR